MATPNIWSAIKSGELPQSFRAHANLQTSWPSFSGKILNKMLQAGIFQNDTIVPLLLAQPSGANTF